MLTRIRVLARRTEGVRQAVRGIRNGKSNGSKLKNTSQSKQSASRKKRKVSVDGDNRYAVFVRCTSGDALFPIRLGVSRPTM